MAPNILLKDHYIKSDKVMLMINYALAGCGLLLAPWYDTWAEALIIGIGTIVAITVIFRIAMGTIVSRIAMAASFMVLTAMHIHQTHGMIEAHFGIFVLLAALLYYRDWIPILAGALIIAVHHLMFFYLQLSGSELWVFQTTDGGWSIVFIHAGYVIAESALFIWLSTDLKREAIQSSEIMSLTDNIIADNYVDLTLRSSGSTHLLKKFDSFTAAVEKLAQEVSKNADQLKIDGSELAEITQEMKHSAEIQQKETDMIATAVEELSCAVEEVSKNADIAASSADQVDKNTAQATAVSEQSGQAIKELAMSVNDATTTIKNLNEETKNIGSVLDVIRGVAEQTNLLALNAAIEAARAGEQGRGFAVVADEVRTLAQRTQESTAEIDRMIESLQSSSESAVVTIESSLSHADSCVQNTQKSLDLMEGVSQSMGEINQMTAMISTSACEQTSVTGEISKNLSNILDASNKAAEDSSKAAESGAALLNMSTDLSELASRFKVN